MGAIAGVVIIVWLAFTYSGSEVDVEVIQSEYRERYFGGEEVDDRETLLEKLRSYSYEKLNVPQEPRNTSRSFFQPRPPSVFSPSGGASDSTDGSASTHNTMYQNGAGSGGTSNVDLSGLDDLENEIQSILSDDFDEILSDDID